MSARLETLKRVLVSGWALQKDDKRSRRKILTANFTCNSVQGREMMTSEMTSGAGPHKKFPVNAFRLVLAAFSLAWHHPTTIRSCFQCRRCSICSSKHIPAMLPSWTEHICRQGLQCQDGTSSWPSLGWKISGKWWKFIWKLCSLQFLSAFSLLEFALNLLFRQCKLELAPKFSCKHF